MELGGLRHIGWDRYTHNLYSEKPPAGQRTLLRRDIGEVRDEAHVTSTAEKHCLIESPAGDRLELWDTPGFGDSVRLAKRLGPPQEPAQAQVELQRWRDRLQPNDCVHEVLALDAFARCWVQENTLLHAVEPLLKPDGRAAYAGLCAAWDARNQAIWRDAMAVLADRLVRAAQDREVVSESGWSGRLKNLGASLGLRGEGSETAREQAMRLLTERLGADIRNSTDRLIQLHGLGGHATDLVLNRLAEQ